MHYKYLSSLLFKYQAALTRIWSTCANISHKTPPFQAGGVVWWELELWLELKVWWEVEVGWETELWWEMVVWQEMHLTQVWLLQSRWQSCDSSQDTLSVLCFPLLSEGSWLWQPRLSPSFPRLLGDSWADRALSLLHHLATFPYMFLSVNRIVHPLCCCCAPNTSLCFGDRPCHSSRDASCPTAASLHFHLCLRHHLGFQ